MSRGSLEVCAHCGAGLETGEWHPVVESDGSDESSYYSFCDEGCREEWESDG